jgi:hypothetical protein
MPTPAEIEHTMLLFHYIPNLPLAIVGIAVFALFAIYLFARVYMSKAPRFLYILAFTALAESLGYIFRVLCYESTTLIKYVIMTFFLLLPPNALALVNYKAVGEIIRLSNVKADKFYLRPKFVTWFFFGSDIFAFFMQGGGGGLQSTGNPGMSNIGKTITLIGLAVQLFFFAFFAYVTSFVHRNPKYQYYVEGQTNPKNKLIRCLYVTIALIYIRSIYRIAEYSTNFDGVIASAEWAFYVFDSLVIALSFLVYSVFFIGNYLPKRINGDATRVRTASSSEELSHVEKGIANEAENVRLYQFTK